jgi:hypothetical protein
MKNREMFLESVGLDGLDRRSCNAHPLAYPPESLTHQNSS